MSESGKYNPRESNRDFLRLYLGRWQGGGYTARRNASERARGIVKYRHHCHSPEPTSSMLLLAGSHASTAEDEQNVEESNYSRCTTCNRQARYTMECLSSTHDVRDHMLLKSEATPGILHTSMIETSASITFNQASVPETLHQKYPSEFPATSRAVI